VALFSTVGAAAAVRLAFGAGCGSAIIGRDPGPQRFVWMQASIPL
jgi:hypothetical protein